MTTGTDQKIRYYLDNLDSVAPIAPSFESLTALSLVPDASKPQRSSGTIFAAVMCTAVLGLGLAALVSSRSTNDRVNLAAPLAPSAPRWFHVIADFIPAEFDFIMASRSTEEFVWFEAFDPDTGGYLHLNVTRVPTLLDPSNARPLTLEAARGHPWFDAHTEYDVELPDGRWIGVYYSSETGESVGPTDGAQTDAEDLRALVLGLADNLTADDLPPVAPNYDARDAAATEIRHIIFDATSSTDELETKTAHEIFRTTQAGGPTASGPLTTRTVTGIIPVP